eukprot:Skav229117  [mRNA]  locus=scaffold92:771978:773120:+ [translate_table: standard]
MEQTLDGKRRRSLPGAASKKRCLEEDLVRCVADVDQAIDHLRGVASSSGRQLVRLLVRSLQVAPEERHRFEALGAELAKEAFEISQGNLRETCQKAGEEAEKFQSFAKGRTKELQVAKEGFSGAIEAFRSAKDAFLADNHVLQGKRKALDAADEELKKSRSNLAKITGSKEELELAVKHMPAIVEGSSDLQLHAEAVLPVIEKVKLEDSLKNAAASSLKLTPEKRGPFDEHVLQQLSAALSGLLEAIPSAEAEESAVQDAEAVYATALEAFNQARCNQARSAHCLRLREIEVRCAQGAEGFAMESLNDAEQELAKSEQELKAAGNVLKAFQDGPMTSLQVLEEAKSHEKSNEKSHAGSKFVDASHDPVGVPTPLRSISVL